LLDSTKLETGSFYVFHLVASSFELFESSSFARLSQAGSRQLETGSSLPDESSWQLETGSFYL
jgi:hypothetical protein